MKKKRRAPQKQNHHIRAVALFANPSKTKALKELPKLKAWLKRKNIIPYPLGKLSKADALIVLGGDGTILSIAPQAAQFGVPVLGINVGHLGFLTVVEMKRMYKAIDQWLSGNWTTSERMLLEVSVPRKRKPLVALNDAVVRLKASNRVTTVSASINSQNLAEFIGDGVIVATTTGSTAYSLSAQGPVVHPKVEAFILTPIAAHSLSQKPLVFPCHHVLELQLNDKRDQNQVQLVLDGQRIFGLRCGDRIRIRRSPYKLKLLHNPKISFFGVLRQKLHWGGR